jgi:hypothetical protein
VASWWNLIAIWLATLPISTKMPPAGQAVELASAHFQVEQGAPNCPDVQEPWWRKEHDE